MRLWWYQRLAVAVLALVTGVAIVDRYHVGVFHDDAMYVILSKAIASGQGYRYINLPDAPSASHFPPGYPLVLAALWKVAPAFPANLLLFKLVNVVLFVACAVLVTQLAFERLGSTRVALALGAVTAVSVPLLVLVSMVLSETLFLAVLLAALLVGERLNSGGEHPRRAVAAGVIVGMSMLVRAHGVVLLLALLIPLVRGRRWRDAGLVASGAAIAVLPWTLWSALHAGALAAPLAGNYGSYAAWWMRGFREMGPVMIPETVRRTGAEGSAMLAALFSPARSSSAHAATLVFLATLAAAGAWSLRGRAQVTLWFLAGYMAIVLVWPFPPTRFIWGVWPLLLLVLTSGAHAAVTSLGPSRLARVGVAAAFCWIVVGYGGYELRAAKGRWWSSISRVADRRISAAVAWTVANTQPGDIVAADDEGAVFLYTGRRTVPVASFTTDHYLKARTAQTEAHEGLEPLLAAYPLRAVVVGSRPTYEAALYLASLPTPRLAPRDTFAEGAAFTVLPR